VETTINGRVVKCSVAEFRELMQIYPQKIVGQSADVVILDEIESVENKKFQTFGPDTTLKVAKLARKLLKRHKKHKKHHRIKWAKTSLNSTLQVAISKVVVPNMTKKDCLEAAQKLLKDNHMYATKKKLHAVQVSFGWASRKLSAGVSKKDIQNAAAMPVSIPVDNDSVLRP
jgi:hypothetical protein